MTEPIELRGEEVLEELRKAVLQFAGVIAMSQYGVSVVDELRWAGLSEPVIEWATSKDRYR